MPAVVIDETEPEPTITIPERETPLAGKTSAEWALLNLLLTILTGIIMLVLWIGYFKDKKRDDEDEDAEAEYYLSTTKKTKASSSARVFCGCEHHPAGCCDNRVHPNGRHAQSYGVCRPLDHLDGSYRCGANVLHCSAKVYKEEDDGNKRQL